MNFGFDIDDTIIDTNEVEHSLALELMKEFSINHKVDLNHYDSINKFGWSKEIDDIFWKRNVEHIFNAPLKEGVKELFDYLRKENHGIYIITARNDFVEGFDSEKFTLEWFNQNQLVYDKIVFGQSNKSIFCKENNIDIFIDDKIKNCLDVHNAGIKTYIMSATHNMKFTHEEIKRVNNIKEFRQEINKRVA